jgi:phosphoglycerol transferase MdoB-like AlkP superfamily enzyme
MKLKQKPPAWWQNIWTRRVLAAFSLMAFLAIMAVLLTMFLEYRHFIGNPSDLMDFINLRTVMFTFSALLMFLILLFLTGLTGKPIISAGILFSFLTLLTFAHINKFMSRGTPLLPEDFELASEMAALSDMFSMTSLVKTIIAVLLALGLAILLQRFVDKKWRGLFHLPKWVGYTARASVVIISSAIFISLTKDIRNGTGENFQGWTFLGRGTELVAWNQQVNYKNNGFIVGFLYNLSPHKIEQPTNYAAETIAKIKQKYQKTAGEENALRLAPEDEAVNLVVVLNESFVDMRDLETYYTHTGGDITPNLHKIQSQFPHGEMFSPEYGGGTANVEFEALTGLSNYFYNVMPFVHILPKNGQSPSAASLLKPAGYASLGLHAYHPTMYKRNIAYKNLGFDNFYGFEDFEFQAKNGNSAYINDASSYQEVLSRLKESDENMLVSLVTMENHMPYDDTYDEHDFISTAEIEGLDHNQLENYYQSLHNSDQALGDFITALDNFEEKTAVLFYGDHLPGAINNFPEEALSDGLMHKTPFFIYTNFEVTPAQPTAGAETPPAATAKSNQNPNYLGTFSPNYLFGILLDTLNFQKSDRYYLLDELKKTTPVLAHSFFYNHQPEANQALSDYELMNYDLLFGKRYWTKN